MIEDSSKEENLKELLNLDLPEEYIPQEPLPQQHAFLWVPHEEVFYGGAAGGGKSSALLMAALQYVKYPNYNALLLRRTYKDLAQPGALMDRAMQWLAPARKKDLCHWDKQEKRWTFPSGATLSFGYLDTEVDVYNYQGAEYQFIGFDELTQFTETMYLYLHSRIRKSEENPVPTRMRASGNPGGIGHQWVKERFIEKPHTDDPEEQAEQDSRLFIPSGFEDNSHIDQDQYRKSLKKLDAVTRAQLMNGNWDIEAEGNMFKMDWWDGRILDGYYDADKIYFRDGREPVGIRDKIRYWDLASTDEEKIKKEMKSSDPDYTASCLIAWGEDGNTYVLEITRDRLSPSGVEHLVKSKAERDGRTGTMIFLEQEPGSSGVNTVDHYRRYVLPGYSFYGDRPTGNKVERARPASSAVEGGLVYVMRGDKTQLFLREAQAFPLGIHDDMVDAFAGAFLKMATYCTIGQKSVKKSRRRKSRGIWG